MKTLLFVHWNILYNSEGYYIPSIQQLHLKLMKKYRHYFNDVIVILHTDNYHDVNTIHNVKVEFTNIFGNKVIFKVKKNFKYLQNDNITFAEEFIPLLDNFPNDYNLIYYIHDKGIHHLYPEFERVMNFWVASLYYFNFNFLHDHLDDIEDDENKYIIGGYVNKEHLTSEALHIDGGWSIDYHFSGAFFGILPDRYREFCKLNNINIYQFQGTPEFHFFTQCNENNIYSDKHINVLETKIFEKQEDNFYLNIENIIKNNTTEEHYNNICKLIEE